jgi:hypothetical protein
MVHPSYADQVEVCASTATTGQRLQREGKLSEAREQFVACASSTCPREVASVCAGLLSRVDASLPTILFGARDADGHDVVGARVSVDGAPLTSRLEGLAIPIDPGPHVVRFELPPRPPLVLSVVVREGEKNRSVIATFPRDTPTPPPPPRTRMPPILPWVLAGIGVLGVGSFLLLDVDGQARTDSCRSNGGCARSTIDGLLLERGIAFGSVAIGLAAGAIATWLFLAGPPRSHVATRGRL